MPFGTSTRKCSHLNMICLFCSPGYWDTAVIAWFGFKSWGKFEKKLIEQNLSKWIYTHSQLTFSRCVWECASKFVDVLHNIKANIILVHCIVFNNIFCTIVFQLPLLKVYLPCGDSVLVHAIIFLVENHGFLPNCSIT